MTEFIKDSINLSFSQNRDPIIKEGRFTAVNDSIVFVAHHGQKFQADLSLSTDFQIAGRTKYVRHLGTHTDYSGFNRKFITDSGAYDPVSALEEFSKTNTDRAMLKPDALGFIHKHSQADSHEAFLYNMLISWYKAKLYVDNNGEDDIFKVRTSPYRDSHCIIPLDQAFQDHEYEIEVGYPVGIDRMQSASWALRIRENYWTRPYVLHYNASTLPQETFYLVHTLGRTEVSALNFDVTIPSLDTRDLLLDPINGNTFLPDDFEQIPWTQPDVLWQWIIDYVRLNRLEQPFAAAFETFGAMTYHPLPSTAEACSWNKAQLVVTLGKFSPTRARNRANMEGEPYKPYALADEFMVNEVESPAKFITSSALCNYYMWYGIYTLIHNEARSRSAWRTAFTSVSEELQVLTSAAARAAAISAVTGREFSSCMTDGCAMLVDLSVMGSYTQINNVRDLQSAELRPIPINAVYAPVSGSLVLGTMVNDFETTSHLTSNYTLDMKHAHTPSPELTQLAKAATIYRLFGHDLAITNLVTGVQFETWAAVRECIPDVSFIDFDPMQPKHYRIDASVSREGRSHILPPPHVLLADNTASVMIQKPTVTLSNWRQRKIPLRPSLVFSRKKKAVVFRVNAPIKYNFSQFTARAVPVQELSGFRKVTDTVPPRNPEPIRVAQETVFDQHLGVEEAGPADTAE
ncbi:capsid protein [Trichoderma koningiopsis totivirus 1]|uniref:Capsid protein n=1 Tax=Trichoderma koningiopsis totivirus 1 TaxID=2584813 RepID=A0A5Q0TVZ8_9VIRU|nr:capsid protein [Trichoderma koningiopsis totivirus 1]